MLSPLVPPRSLRRCLAALLALSVLLTTLGWASPCPPPGGGVGNGVALAAHDDGAGAPAPHDGCDDAAPDAASRPTTPDGHEGPASEACALVAHCTAAVTADGSVIAIAAQVEVAVRPARAPDARLLGPSYQPESPPPKA